MPPFRTYMTVLYKVLRKTEGWLALYCLSAEDCWQKTMPVSKILSIKRQVTDNLAFNLADGGKYKPAGPARNEAITIPQQGGEEC
jgi:hypothetical protein